MAEITLTREDVQDMLDLYEETNLPRLAAISRLALKSFEPNPARALIVELQGALLATMDEGWVVLCEAQNCKICPKIEMALAGADGWLKANP